MEYTNSQIKELIMEHLHSSRDRRLLYRRLVDGITLEKLGEEFQLSTAQVKRIVYKSEDILFRHLDKTE